MSSTNQDQEKVQLTIRCALQSFSDYNVECELEWTVLQLKQHLARTLDFKPEVERQRLIYAGRYLENKQKIDEVIRMNHIKVLSGEQMEKQVVHMVYNSGKQEKVSSNTEGIRRRTNVGDMGNSSQDLPQFDVQNISPQSQSMLMMPTVDPNVQHSHEAWLAAYQNYIGQMMQYYQNGGGLMQPGMQMHYGLWNPNQFTAFDQQQFTTNQPQFYGLPFAARNLHVPAHQQFQNAIPNQQQQVPFAANPQPNNPQIDAAAQMPDFLDLVYKSIRFVLLAIIVYLYSSFERFISVLCILALFWFIHARRGQQNGREQQNGEPIPAERVREQEPNQNNDIDAENNNPPANSAETPAEAAIPVASNVQPVIPNAPLPTENTMTVYNTWNVFWTTIQSFFTSLIPENPAPLDIN